MQAPSPLTRRLHLPGMLLPAITAAAGNVVKRRPSAGVHRNHKQDPHANGQQRGACDVGVTAMAGHATSSVCVRGNAKAGHGMASSALPAM